MAEAKDIYFEFIEDVGEYAILGEHQFVVNEDNRKQFHIELLYPHGEYGIYVVCNRGPKNSYEVIYSWENPDGTRNPPKRHRLTRE